MTERAEELPVRATRIRFSGQELSCGPRETVLECLERQGHTVPSFCRSGVCQACMLQATGGSVPAAAQAGLKSAWRERGYFLSCICKPTSALDVEPCGVVRSHRTRIESVERMSARVLRVRLLTPAEFAYRAGQFIQLERPSDGLLRPYSIASRPDDGVIELHVAMLQNGQMSGWLAGAAHQEVNVRGPLGDCYYQGDEPESPLILAGTGTGMAPLIGIVRSAQRAEHRGPIVVYHGSVTVEGLYLFDELAELRRALPNLTLVGSVLSDEGLTQEHTAAGIEQRPLDELVLQAAKTTASPRVYLCGDPQLVGALRKRLFLQGLSLQRIHADPFLAPPEVKPKPD